MLILNAGIMSLPELEQVNGIEKQFFVNHIGHFALTSHLLDQVKAAPQGRVVIVSSSGHAFAPEAGIEFDEHLIQLDTATTKKEIAAFSEAGRVPVLQLGDMTIWDSLAIAETVAERWPEKKLWPEDADERAHARAISAEMHSGFQQLRDCMPMNCRAMGRRIEIPDELGEDIDRVIAIWAECHKHFGDRGGWLFGTFSVISVHFR